MHEHVCVQVAVNTRVACDCVAKTFVLLCLSMCVSIYVKTNTNKLAVQQSTKSIHASEWMACIYGLTFLCAFFKTHENPYTCDWCLWMHACANALYRVQILTGCLAMYEGRAYTPLAQTKPANAVKCNVTTRILSRNHKLLYHYILKEKVCAWLQE